MGNVKKSVVERTRHQRQYDRMVNKRQMQTQESKVDTGNDADADDANIKPVYDEEPMAEVQLTAECNVFVTGQQHVEQPEFNNEGRVDQDTYKDLYDSIKKTRVQMKDHNDSLIALVNKKSTENADLKAQLQEKFSSQVDVKNDLSKPLTPHYLPKVQESAFPLFEEYFTARNQSVSKSSALSDNSKQQDTQPTSNIQHTTEPKTPTANVNVEENNTDQAADAQFQPYEFFNPFCTPVQEVDESSSRNIDNLNMHTFYQRHRSNYYWTKNNLLEQVCGNLSKPVQTR
ncbi:hypothetical protein Tco_0383350 [Tanacetum coccineum]